ncbi:HEPN domain-containing protein [Cellulomonas hominis]|uniref:HEPN domain-containing protein n=1 Tax=Cellulomonas hominis TaxID=156981 RepID=UPI0014443DD4|nr:HEPN domain-containing protein [Cellulomonas hominis]
MADGWDPNARGIGFLVGRGRLERVIASVPNARYLLAESRRHLASSALLADVDVSLAFLAAYDAARQALTAILMAQGLRVTGGDGGHAVLLDAVRPQFPTQRAILQEFDWMRQTRNATQYPDFEHPTATPADVAEARTAAASIVDLADRWLAALPS